MAVSPKAQPKAAAKAGSAKPRVAMQTLYVKDLSLRRGKVDRKKLTGKERPQAKFKLAITSKKLSETLWEVVLATELFRMNKEVTKEDKLLDDERFFVPFRNRIGTTVGRPTTVVAT